MTTKRIAKFLGLVSIIVALAISAILWHNSASAQTPRQRLEARPDQLPDMGTPAICEAKGFVYVVTGNTLFKFDAADLKLVNKAPIEQEPRFRPDEPDKMDRHDRMEDVFPPSRKETND
jgi:hypothetical protein